MEATVKPPPKMKTVKVLSRCHESTIEWVPEPLSPVKLRAALEICKATHEAGTARGDYAPALKASMRKAAGNTSNWVKDGYFKPMNWKPEEAAELRQWRREQRPILTGARTVLI